MAVTAALEAEVSSRTKEFRKNVRKMGGKKKRILGRRTRRKFKARGR
jgi:hypothetical protein